MPVPSSASRGPALLAGLILVLTLSACAGGDTVSLTTAGGPAMARATDPAASDRIVRLHTRLMVAGLGCGPDWQDPGTFGRYAAFVARNAEVIRVAQQDMAARLGGLSEFDTEHTVLSNQEALRMRQMGTRNYCAEMRAPFYAAMAADPAALSALP